MTAAQAAICVAVIASACSTGPEISSSTTTYPFDGDGVDEYIGDYTVDGPLIREPQIDWEVCLSPDNHDVHCDRNAELIDSHLVFLDGCVFMGGITETTRDKPWAAVVVSAEYSWDEATRSIVGQGGERFGVGDRLAWGGGGSSIEKLQAVIPGREVPAELYRCFDVAGRLWQADTIGHYDAANPP